MTATDESELPVLPETSYSIRFEISNDGKLWRRGVAEQIPNAANSFLVEAESDAFFRITVFNGRSSTHHLEVLVLVEDQEIMEGASIIHAGDFYIFDSFITTNSIAPLKFARTQVNEGEDGGEALNSNIGLVQLILTAVRILGTDEPTVVATSDISTFSQQSVACESQTKQYGLSISTGEAEPFEEMVRWSDVESCSRETVISFICRDKLGMVAERMLRGMPAPSVNAALQLPPYMGIRPARPSGAAPTTQQSPANANKRSLAEAEEQSIETPAKRQRVTPSASSSSISNPIPIKKEKAPTPASGTTITTGIKQESVPSSNAAKTGIRAWNAHQVAEWIANHDPKFKSMKYDQIFLTNDVDGEALCLMSHDLLKEMKIDIVGHRAKLLAAIQTLKSISEPVPAPTARESATSSSTIIIIDDD